MYPFLKQTNKNQTLVWGAFLNINKRNYLNGSYYFDHSRLSLARNETAPMFRKRNLLQGHFIGNIKNMKFYCKDIKACTQSHPNTYNT